MFLQRDGAARHIRSEVTKYLNWQLPERWIGRVRGQFLASAISGSHPLDFFLWGFLKDEVYVPQVPITEQLEGSKKKSDCKN
jgi:hypothetical protein